MEDLQGPDEHRNVWGLPDSLFTQVSFMRKQVQRCDQCLRLQTHLEVPKHPKCLEPLCLYQEVVCGCGYGFVRPNQKRLRSCHPRYRCTFQGFLLWTPSSSLVQCPGSPSALGVHQVSLGCSISFNLNLDNSSYTEKWTFFSQTIRGMCLFEMNAPEEMMPGSHLLTPAVGYPWQLVLVNK